MQDISRTRVEETPGCVVHSAKTPNSGPSEKVRRTRGSSAARPTPTSRAERATAPTNRSGLAASDDAREFSAVTAAAPSAARTEREACAEAADVPNGNSPQPRVPGETQQQAPHETVPLPDDPAAFVEEIHQRVDLFEKWEKLLNSDDDKIRQRATEKLTEMRYKGISAMSEEPQPVVFDWARANRAEE